MKHGIPLFLFLLLVVTVAISLTLGKYQVSSHDMIAFAGYKLFGSGSLDMQKAALLDNLLLDIRLPRILAALLVGASLSISGASYQAMFINPLVSPKMLGVLAGASFGAVTGMLLTQSWFTIQISAVAFGFIAVGIAVWLAKLYQIDSLIMLVISGIISEALFTALVSIVKYEADPYNQLPAIVYWLMGSLSMVDRREIFIVSIPMLTGIVALTLYGRHLNVLSMGDEEASALGIRVKSTRYAIIFFSTLISALTVMIGGIIGWVGLIIPHMARTIVGPDNVKLLPASALMGAIYLILVDDFARLLFNFEVPIGIVTSLIGIPFFAIILKNARKGWD